MRFLGYGTNLSLAVGGSSVTLPTWSPSSLSQTVPETIHIGYIYFAVIKDLVMVFMFC